MRAIPSRRETTGTRSGDASEQAREDIANLLRQSIFLQGRIVSVTLAATTAKAVRHDIGVRCAFIVVRQNYNGAGTTAKLGEATTAFQAPLDQKRDLGIVADVACTVDLYFYPVASKPIDALLGQSK